MFTQLRSTSNSTSDAYVYVDEKSESSPLVDGKSEAIARLVEIDTRDAIWSVGFLADGKHVVGGGWGGKIRSWQVEDGEEVGLPMDTGSWVNNIAVSSDGKWIVSGMSWGQVTVWNAHSREKALNLKGHGRVCLVNAVDISQDGSKILTGSGDRTARVWSRATGEQLLRLDHNGSVAAAKFSPDGRLFATTTLNHDSARVYDAHDGHFLAEFKIKVDSVRNQSLAWGKDSNSLFVLSSDDHVHHLGVAANTTFSKWLVHTTSPTCIASASNGKYIAVSAGSSISLWDTATYQQIGSPIEHTDTVRSMVISPNHNILTGGGGTISLWDLCNLLPSYYCDNDYPPSEVNTEKTVQELQNELSSIQSRYLAQARELVFLRNQLKEKDRTIAAFTAQLNPLNYPGAAKTARDYSVVYSTTQVDHPKRSDFARTDGLATLCEDVEQLRCQLTTFLSVHSDLKIPQSLEIQQNDDDQTEPRVDRPTLQAVQHSECDAEQ